MRLNRPAITVLAVVSGLACLVGETIGERTLVYLAKPATTIAIVSIAFAGTSRVSSLYKVFIVAGLGFGLVGDVFLMVPGDRFIAGLASFLVGHLLYTGAFITAGGGPKGVRSALGVAAIALSMLVLLWPQLGAVRIPVVVYVVVIALMAWQAIARWEFVRGTAAASGAALAASGSLLFLVSDGSLAVRRFLGEFAGATPLVLGTYWTAQYLIARSVTR